MFLLCFILSGLASAKEPLQTRLQDFVEVVYQNYAAERFGDVYAVMHPSVQAVLAAEEYLAFQTHHFQRLRLRISEIEVGEVGTNPRIPLALQGLLSDDFEQQLYGVSLRYRAQFVSGVRMSQTISKTVYVAVMNQGTDKESTYLLWDPSSIEEEEQEQ